MDNLTPNERSAQMALVRSKNTKPEMIVRKIVFNLGYRYRLHRSDLPGKPDLVFGPRKKIIFIHGCFWHGHKCHRGRTPKSRIEFWTNKIVSNRDRDKKNIKSLKASDWTLLILWECQLKNKADLVRRIKEFLNGK